MKIRTFLHLLPLALALINITFAVTASAPSLCCYKKPGLELYNKGNATINLTGSIITDYVNFFNYRQELNSGYHLRRARLDLNGKIANWKFRLAVDDAATNKLIDAYLQYWQPHKFYITAGQYRPASSIQFLTSTLNQEFMESSLPVLAFNPQRAIGMQFNYYTASLNLAAGIFGPRNDRVTNGIEIIGKNPLGYNGKIQWTPINQSGKLILLGLSYYYRNTPNSITDNDVLQFRAFPELRSKFASNLLNTGLIQNAKNYSILNPEVAVIDHSLSFETGYFHDFVNRNMGLSQLNFNGYYLQTGYFLTGETRTFDQPSGRFTGISKINHCYGAIQLVARYSGLDLNNQNIQGGVEHNVTLGINYYPTRILRFSVNAMHGVVHPDSFTHNKSFNGIGVRAQLLI